MSYVTHVAKALEREEREAGTDTQPTVPPAVTPAAEMTDPEPAPLRPGELLARFRRRLGRPQHPVVYYDPTVVR